MDDGFDDIDFSALDLVVENHQAKQQVLFAQIMIHITEPMALTQSCPAG